MKHEIETILFNDSITLKSSHPKIMDRVITQYKSENTITHTYIRVYRIQSKNGLDTLGSMQIRSLKRAIDHAIRSMRDEFSDLRIMGKL
jgi:hypothetical protein